MSTPWRSPRGYAGFALVELLKPRLKDQTSALRLGVATGEGTRLIGADPSFAVEIMVERHPNGDLGVIDPKYGTWGWAKSDLVSWGVLGVAVGLLSGLISGGLFGAVHSGIATGLIWAAFGLFAGALYGLWAGRAVTGRRLKSAARLLTPGTSLVVAWSEQPITGTVLAPYMTADSQHLVLHFNSTEGGVVLEAS